MNFDKLVSLVLESPTSSTEINVEDGVLSYSVNLDENFNPVKIYTYTRDLQEPTDYGYSTNPDRDYEMLFLHDKTNYTVNPLNPTFSTLRASTKMLRKIWDVYLRDFANLDEVANTITEKKETQNVPKPNDLKEIMHEVSLGKDEDGFFVYTHRCRSDSYPTPHKIPKSKIKFVGSTG